MRERVSLDDAKQIMLGILKSVDKCCRANQIKYSLDWGTLLGAVRHKGFIPWDDDIDLMMPRADFNSFLQLYNDDRYDLITNDDPEWGWNYVRICDKKTEVVFDKNSERIRPHGLWLSIFPIDSVPDNPRQWRLLRIRINFFHSLCRLKRSVWTDTNPIKNIIKCLARFVLKPFSLVFLSKKEEKLLSKYSNIRTEYSFQRDVDYHIRLTGYLDSVIDIVFEDGLFLAIKEYDRYLTEEYGNYMQFPPEDKRKPSHGYIAYYK